MDLINRWLSRARPAAFRQNRLPRLVGCEMLSLAVFTDGAIYPERGISGLAAIVRDEQGQIRYWWKQKAGAMTCNEAEYAAAVMAFERLRQLKPDRVVLYSDSRTMVDQMKGLAQVRSVNLRPLNARLRQLTTEFKSVQFQHIPREQNQLADALAYEAITSNDVIYL